MQISTRYLQFWQSAGIGKQLSSAHYFRGALPNDLPWWFGVSDFIPWFLLCSPGLPDGFLSEPDRQRILFGWMSKGLVCTQERVKKPFYRRVSMDTLSWIILTPVRNLFVPVSTEWFEKAPHILWFFLLDIRLLFLYMWKRCIFQPNPKWKSLGSGPAISHCKERFL